MSERPAPVQRPNGKWWRGRKPIRVSFVDSYDGDGGVVLGTHDIDEATRLAIKDLASLDLIDAPAQVAWWRLVPWDATGAGYDSTWIVDPVGGTPCVVWTP